MIRETAEHGLPTSGLGREFLGEAQKHLKVRPKTFADYARALRLIAAHVAGIQSDASKFDHLSEKNGHAA